MEEKYLCTREVAVILRVSQKTVYRLMDEGRLKFIRVRKVYRIPLREVMKYIKKQEFDSDEF